MTSLKYSVCMTLAVLALAGCSKPSGDGADDGDGGGTPPAAATADSAASPAAAVATAGGAISPMTQKAGLWQLTQTVGTHPATVTKMCVDAAMGANMATAAMSSNMPAVDCSQKSVTPGVNGTDIAMTCTASGKTIASKIHVERVSDTEYHQTMNATFTPAVAGHDSISSTTDGKWLSACPADMKPGDIITSVGVKINMYDAMNKMKGMGAQAPN